MTPKIGFYKVQLLLNLW